MYQTGEQVWAGLAHEIITQITGRLPRLDRERFWLELNLRRVDRQAVRRKIYGVALERLAVPALVLAASLLLTAAFGLTRMVIDHAELKQVVSWAQALLTPSGALGFVKEELGSFNDMIRDPDYQSKVGFLYLMHSDIQKVSAERGKRPERTASSVGAKGSAKTASAPGLTEQKKPGDDAIRTAKKEKAVSEQVKAIELESKDLTLGSLSEERDSAQKRLQAEGVEEEEAFEMAAEAVARLLPKVYSDADEIVQTVITRQALQLPSRNPRELKRLINLFRFYTLVANERRVFARTKSESQEESFKKVARLSVLILCWPSLLNALAHPVEESGAASSKQEGAKPAADAQSSPQEEDDPGAAIWLEKLEEAAAKSQTEWTKQLKASGLIPAKGANAWEPPYADLRNFLKETPAIGKFARGFI